MRCNNCGIQLPSGVAYCPNCGSTVPYNVGSASNSTTVQGTPSPHPPTTYGTPPPPPQIQVNQNPYPYDATPPPAQPGIYPQSGGLPYGQTPQQGNVYNNAVPPIPAPGGFGIPQTATRKSNTGLIVGVVAAVLVLAIIVGSIIVVPRLATNGTNKGSSVTSNTRGTAQVSQTATTTATATTTTSNIPSGQNVDAAASAIVTNLQMASAIDETTTEPTQLATTFQKNQKVYATFKLNSDKFDFDKNTAYVGAKFYAGTRLAFKATPLKIDHIAPGGAFIAQYYVATPASVGIYWCLQADCSDEKLAQTTTFTITD